MNVSFFLQTRDIDIDFDLTTVDLLLMEDNHKIKDAPQSLAPPMANRETCITEKETSLTQSTFSLPTSKSPKTVVVARQADDVLLGRGNVRWEGNLRFQTVVRQNAQRYHEADSRSVKSRIVFEIVGAVQAWGGRFLHPMGRTARSAKVSVSKRTPRARGISGDDGIQWCLANNFQIRKKIGQALRYQMTDQCKSEVSSASDNERRESLLSRSSDSSVLDNDARNRPKSLVTTPLEVGGQGPDVAKPPNDRTFCLNSAHSSSSSSCATYIEDDNDDQIRSGEKLSGAESVGSLDISVLMDLWDSDSDHTMEHGQNSTKPAPLLTNQEILSSLGYDANAFLPKQVAATSEPAVITDTSIGRYSLEQQQQQQQQHVAEHLRAVDAESVPNNNHHLLETGITRHASSGTTRMLSDRNSVHLQAHADNESCSSLDVSLSAIKLAEDQEDWGRNFSSPLAPLVSDEAILAFVDQTGSDQPERRTNGPTVGESSCTTSSLPTMFHYNYKETKKET